MGLTNNRVGIFDESTFLSNSKAQSILIKIAFREENFSYTSQKISKSWNSIHAKIYL